MKAPLASCRSGILFSLAVLAASLLVLPGCGSRSKKQLLSGKVLLGDKPVTGGDIKFYPLSPTKGQEGPFMGSLSNKGEYTATNLPNGELAVTVNTDSAKSFNPMGNMPKPPAGVEVKQMEVSGGPVYMPIPDKYKDPKTSPLRVTITGGKQEQDLKLTE